MTGQREARAASSHANSFVAKLIRLQQDGKEAISGPANWLDPPLLEVATDSDADLQELLDGMCPGKGTAGRGRWHWLVGSPGNGKSAKLGLLARRLLDRGYEILSEDGVALGELDARFPPYLLEVREPGKPYRFAYLVQDASVVREPFGAACDPAEDLADLLREAVTHGVSLLLCTNWGVLQRLFDRGHTDPEVREEPWFRAVRTAVRGGREPTTVYSGAGGKAVFDEMVVTYEVLDNRSLLIGSSVFERLVAKATDEERWVGCEGCPSLRLCPLRANRDDLVSEDHLQQILDILRRAEVLDGQVLVFREAVALVSLFLAGCPNDHGGMSPCEWVHGLVESGDVFGLMARRVPALLFGSSRCHGLEPSNGADRRRGSIHGVQLAAIKEVSGLLDRVPEAQQAIQAVASGEHLSVDVGVTRLLGPDGILRRLDPSLDPRNAVLLDEFTASVTTNSPDAPRGIGELERRCIHYWDTAFDAIEAAADPVSGLGLYFWIRRWQTTRLAWIAAVSEGATAHQTELDNYITFLSSSGGGSELLAKLKRLEEVLEQLLAPRGRGSSGVEVELAASMWLSGRWAEAELRPQLEHGRDKASNALFVKMSKNHPFLLTAESFVWLSLRHDLGLSDLSFNPDLLESLRRAQAQAAAASRYSLQDDDVRITVLGENGTRYELERTRGYLLGLGDL